MFVALSTLAKIWKDKKRKKDARVSVILPYIYISIKKNDILPFAMTWMELEFIILIQINQSERDKYHMISLICGI